MMMSRILTQARQQSARQPMQPPMARPRTRARLAVCSAYLALGVACLAATPVLANQNAPELSPCHIEGVEAQARCGYLDVPINWDDPSAGTLALFVAVVPPSGGAVTDSPLYVLAGGPGQAASDLGGFVDGALVPARRSREVILVDQRGTGRTAPFNCPTPSDPRVLGDVTARTCLASTDNDPRFFGSDAFINDLHAIRNAFGHDTIHLWGGSYGTRAALLYLARFEHTVASVILDAVAPTPTAFLPLALKSAGDSLSKVVAACAADAPCNDRFPHLAQDLDQLVADLDSAPRDVTINGVAVSVDASIFMNGLRNAFYARNSTSWVPFAVTEFARGDPAPWIAMSDVSGRIMEKVSLGTMLSVMCGEEIPRMNKSGLAPTPTPFAHVDLSFWPSACTAWPNAPVPDEFDQPVKSNVPVLLLSGALDPVTPPAFARDAAAHLTNSVHLVAQHNAHITSGFGCAPRLIGEFLDTRDPASLDAECLNRIGQAPFLLGPEGTAP